MNNQYFKLINNLDTLGLIEIKNSIDNVIERVNNEELNFTDALYELTERELSFQKERAKVALIKVANFPFQKTFSDYDFSFQPSINKNEIIDCKYLKFVENKENIIFLGPPGVGKTHLATAIGMETALNRISTYFISCHDLILQLKRAHLERARSKWYRYRKFTKRPRANCPGALVEVDTGHFYHPITKKRKYATSVVDVYSRMAFVYFHDNMQQYHSVTAVLLAKRRFGFHFDTVQTDNGPEFGKKFQDEIIRRGMKWRHTRVRRPNDNAHVEKFNRTLREECLGNYIPTRETLEQT